jgi:hypothetical protein
MSARRNQMLPPECASGAEAARSRRPLAFRRSTAALARATERSNSAQAALHAKGRRRRYPRRQSRLSGAPRAPVVVPKGTMPGPPGGWVTNPARRNRTRSTNRPPRVDVPRLGEIRSIW